MKKLDKKFLEWATWLHENCVALRLNAPEKAAYPFFRSVDNILSEEFTVADIEVLIMWTHPRFETGARMTIPVDVDNTGGWGAIRRVGEIREYVLQYKHENFPT